MMSQNNNNNDFDAFNSIADDKMESSMMSNNNEDKNLDWFGSEEQANK